MKKVTQIISVAAVLVVMVVLPSVYAQGIPGATAVKILEESFPNGIKGMVYSPYSANAAQTNSPNTLHIDNQSGKVLYIAVNRADNLWLDFTKNKWGTKTLGENNIHETTGSSDSISLIDTEGPAANVYVLTFKPTGKPNVVTSKQIWDQFEYTTNAVWDITAVDAVGIPMALEYKTRLTGYRNIPRDFILKQFLNLPPPFNSQGAIIRDASNNIVRALAPKHYLPSNTKVLDKAMDVGFPKYNHLGGLSITSGPWTYTDFSWDSSSRALSAKSNGQPITIGGGTGANAFTSKNVISTAMTEPNNAVGRLTGLIETAINRGVLYNPALWGTNDKTQPGIVGFPWNYYQDNASNANQYSYYSKTVHQWSINGMNYGLDHDDFYNRSSSITVPPGEPVTLHIWKFKEDSQTYKPITWPNHNYLTLGIPQAIIDNLGFVDVNNKQYVIPDLRNVIPAVGLPQSTNIQFSKFPGKLLKIDIVNKKVLNPSDWVNGNNVVIQNNFLVALPPNLAPRGGGPVNLNAAVDIMPRTSPNSLDVNSTGIFPVTVAILGTEDFNVNNIDLNNCFMEGIVPLRSSFMDVATPSSNGGGDPCLDSNGDANDDDLGGLLLRFDNDNDDGKMDLVLTFDKGAIIDALGEVSNGDCVRLTFAGKLVDGTPIGGSDYILVEKDPLDDDWGRFFRRWRRSDKSGAAGRGTRSYCTDLLTRCRSGDRDACELYAKHCQ